MQVCYTSTPQIKGNYRAIRISHIPSQPGYHNDIALSREHYNDITRKSFFQLTELRHGKKALSIYSKRKFLIVGF